jgi:hypothetical protein
VLLITATKSIKEHSSRGMPQRATPWKKENFTAFLLRYSIALLSRIQFSLNVQVLILAPPRLTP